MSRSSRIVLLLMLSAMVISISNTQNNATNQTTVIPSIYGVRWFLGEHFKFTIDNNDQNKEYYILMFNSNDQLEGDLIVKIPGNEFTCTSTFISTTSEQVHHDDFNTNVSQIGDVFNTTIHKCILGNIQSFNKDNSTALQIGYQIVLGNLQFRQIASIQSDGYEQISLFNGTFRIPVNADPLEVLVIGDWGQITQIGQKKGYHHVMPCIVQKLQQNPNIVMVIFNGDLAYDLQGQLYYNMLKHMEVITSKLVFMVTPGNHDTLHHADTFQLFTQSFYSPQWKKYLNFFYTIKIGSLVFISYNPELEAYDFTKQDRSHQNLTNIFEKQFPLQVLKALNSSYFNMVFSHYPIYCSNILDDISSCQKNVVRMKSYREYFNNISMKLYFSGHLHLYERTKPICYNGSFPYEKSNQVDLQCPVYIVEGAGGNNDYIQTDEQYPLKYFSNSLVYNTGFGILTISNPHSTPNITFRHISSQNCSVTDWFLMKSKPSKTIIDNNDGSLIENKNRFQNYLPEAIILVLGIIFIIIFIIAKKKCTKQDRVNSPNTERDHVQMVEEHFQPPQNSSEPNDPPEAGSLGK